MCQNFKKNDRVIVIFLDGHEAEGTLVEINEDADYKYVVRIKNIITNEDMNIYCLPESIRLVTDISR